MQTFGLDEDYFDDDFNVVFFFRDIPEFFRQCFVNYEPDLEKIAELDDTIAIDIYEWKNRVCIINEHADNEMQGCLRVVQSILQNIIHGKYNKIYGDDNESAYSASKTSIESLCTKLSTIEDEKICYLFCLTYVTTPNQIFTIKDTATAFWKSLGVSILRKSPLPQRKTIIFSSTEKTLVDQVHCSLTNQDYDLTFTADEAVNIFTIDVDKSNNEIIINKK